MRAAEGHSWSLLIVSPARSRRGGETNRIHFEILSPIDRALFLALAARVRRGSPDPAEKSDRRSPACLSRGPGDLWSYSVSGSGDPDTSATLTQRRL